MNCESNLCLQGRARCPTPFTCQYALDANYDSAEMLCPDCPTRDTCMQNGCARMPEIGSEEKTPKWLMVLGALAVLLVILSIELSRVG